MREIQKIYWMYFLAGLSNIAAFTFTLYFLSHGLSQAQIGQLFGFFMICLAIFDIPTGGIADIFGHKISVAIGLLFQAISFLLFFLFPNYIGFLLGMFANAIGLAFQSGATSSLIFELLKKENKQDTFQKITGKAGAYNLVGAFIAGPLGFFLFKYYPQIPYLLAFFFFLFAAILVYFITWEFTKRPPSFSLYSSTIIRGIQMTLKNRILIATIIIGFGLTVNRLVFNQNISQPYQLDIGIDVAFIGIILAIITAVQAFVSLYTQSIFKKLGENTSMICIVLIPSLSAILLSFLNSLFAIPIIILFYSGHIFRDTVMTHIGQKVVDPDKRSTMASTTSFLISISSGVLLPYWGKTIDNIGIHSTLFLLGLFSLCVGLLGYVLYAKKG